MGIYVQGVWGHMGLAKREVGYNPYFDYELNTNVAPPQTQQKIVAIILGDGSSSLILDVIVHQGFCLIAKTGYRYSF